MRLTRRTALAAAGAPLALSALTPAVRAASTRTTLSELIALERRLESAYEAAARRGTLDHGLAELLRDHEGEHAEGLSRAVRARGGGDASPRATVPSPALNRALAGGSRAFARHAIELENQAVVAYLAAIETIREPALLQPLGSIMASEGQHLVLLREAAGIEPLSRSFEP